MSDAARRNQTASLTRTERELARLEGGGASATSGAPTAANKPKPKPVVEKKGTGTDNTAENAKRLAKAARAKLDAALKAQANARQTGNTALANRLDAVIARNRAALEGK